MFRYAFHDHSHSDLAGIPMNLQYSNYNIRPGASCAVAVERVQHYNWTYRIQGCRWGLEPLWSAKDKRPIKTVRMETVMEQMTTHYPRRRCLVPANGWYELDKEGHAHYFKHSNALLIWMGAVWTGTKENGSFAIITRPSTPDLVHIQERMPVVISDGLTKGWMSDATNRYDAISMMGALPTWTFEAYQTTDWILAPLNDGPACIENFKSTKEPRNTPR